MGSQGSAGGNNGQQGDQQDQNGGLLQNAQNYLSLKYPNKRIYRTPVDVSFKPNTDRQGIDPLLPDNGITDEQGI